MAITTLKYLSMISAINIILLVSISVVLINFKMNSLCKNRISKVSPPQHTSQNISSQTLVIYEGYHSSAVWQTIHTPHDILFPLCLATLEHFPTFEQVYVPKYVPAARSRMVQTLFSEYCAILAIPWVSHGRWVGYQSHRAAEKRIALTDQAMFSLRDQLARNESFYSSSDFFYWGALVSNNISLSILEWHGKGMMDAFCSAFKLLFFSSERIDLDRRALEGQEPNLWQYFPDLPIHSQTWSFSSHFIMEREAMADYAEFCRKLIVALESLYYVSQDIERCPIQFFIGGYPKERCWGYLLERTVNLWVYHTGMRMYFVDMTTGAATEYMPVADRKTAGMFSETSLQNLAGSFEKRLSCRAQAMYTALGGELDASIKAGC